MTRPPATCRAAVAAALAAVVVAMLAAAVPEAGALPASPARTFSADFDDPGTAGVAGGWRADQWPLVGRWGVRAEAAWRHAALAGRPGGAGVVVAVLDSGVRATEDLAGRLLPGFDALRGAGPVDHSGHGTHVASTIAAAAGNGTGLVGLAYGASIMPVRVLDGRGKGRADAIAAGIRWAVAHGADVLALSFAFGSGVLTRDVPDVMAALDEAAAAGVVLVAAAGNDGRDGVALPARHPEVLAVGATTARGCRAATSNRGAGVDLVAPGGGPDAGDADDAARCAPEAEGRDVRALGFRGGGPERIVGRDGTSHAVPHVAAAAALVLASGALGPEPAPAAVREHLRATARDLGAPGPDPQYGAGLLDAGAATLPPPGP